MFRCAFRLSEVHAPCTATNQKVRGSKDERYRATVRWTVATASVIPPRKHSRTARLECFALLLVCSPQRLAASAPGGASALRPAGARIESLAARQPGSLSIKGSGLFLMLKQPVFHAFSTKNSTEPGLMMPATFSSISRLRSSFSPDLQCARPLNASRSRFFAAASAPQNR